MAKEMGRIVAGIGGNYDVLLENGQILRLKARGVFRKQGITPLLGDRVTVPGDGYFDEILERKNESIRPAAANIDQMLVVFAARYPDPHFKLLDRFLIECDRRRIPCLIVFNKADLLSEEERKRLQSVLTSYEKAGYEVELVSTLEEGAQETREKLLPRLTGKLTIFAGPSGVGKSSLINRLTDAVQETGDLSEKIARGKNTTRHARLLPVRQGGREIGLIGDTPGFSSFYMQQLSQEELGAAYPEFQPYLGKCRFTNCRHLRETDCAIREAVLSGELSRVRYRNYVELLQDMISGRRP